MNSFIHELLSDPQHGFIYFLVIAIHFITGFTLGYLWSKALKYVLALIALIAACNYLLISFLPLKLTLGDALEVIGKFLPLLTLSTAPLLAGFIVGAIAALLRR